MRRESGAPTRKAGSRAAKARSSGTEALLARYLDYLAHERRSSPHTVQNYRRDIAALLERAGATPLTKLQVHDIRRFIAQLHGAGLGARSIARMLSAWRGFYRYLARDHGYVDNPALGIRAPKSGEAPAARAFAR